MLIAEVQRRLMSRDVPLLCKVLRVPVFMSRPSTTLKVVPVGFGQASFPGRCDGSLWVMAIGDRGSTLQGDELPTEQDLWICLVGLDLEPAL